MRTFASCWALLLGAFWASSCTDSSGETEVVIHFDVDAALVARASSIRVRAFDTDGALAADEARSFPGTALPLRLPLFPQGDGPRSYHVVADLSGTGGDLGVQRLLGGYVDGESRVLRARFTEACVGTTCAGHETCRSVGAVPECVDACFDPQVREDEELPASRSCPRVVWVDGATGTDDEAACTGPDAPCADVMYALDTYVGDGLGGVVNVAGGSDYGRLHLRSNGPNHGGTLETPTVVRAWPGTGRPAFSSSTNWALGTCCSDVSADNFVFEGLEVTEAIEAGVHIHGENVDRAEIRDCLVRGVRHEETVRYPNQTAGIVITNQPTGVLLVGNRIEDNVAVGVAEDGSPAPVHGIAITNTEGGMTLERNVVIGNAGSGIYVGNAGHTIIGNRISRNGESGILFVNARETLVEDNQICDVGAVGLDIVNSDLLRVSHNTVVGSGAQGLLLTSFSDDNVVVGNLFADNAGAGMERTAEPGDPEDFDNLFWMNATDRISIDPDGTVWDDEIEPFFRDREGCDLTLVDGPAASLVDGGPVGSRVVFAE